MAALWGFDIYGTSTHDITYPTNNTAHFELNGLDASNDHDLIIEFAPSGDQPAAMSRLDGDSNETYIRFALPADSPIVSSDVEPMPRSLLFLVDASGSMGPNGRWTAARTVVEGAIDALDDDETYAVVTFRGKSVHTLPGDWISASDSLR